LNFVWLNGGVLAAANAEALLRLWHLEADSNYILTLPGWFVVCLR
jgi:hypothetical protein